MEPRLATLLQEIRSDRGRVVALTGAGISAESGIPTFRGMRPPRMDIGEDVVSPYLWARRIREVDVLLDSRARRSRRRPAGAGR